MADYNAKKMPSESHNQKKEITIKSISGHKTTIKSAFQTSALSSWQV